MKRLLIIAVLLSMVAGCAPNYIRVVRLDASGQFIPFVDAQQAGCYVESDGNMAGVTIDYKDDKCSVSIKK